MQRSSDPVVPYTSLNIPVSLHADVTRAADTMTCIAGGPYTTKSALMRDVVVAFCCLLRVGGRPVNEVAGVEAMRRLRLAVSMAEAVCEEESSVVRASEGASTADGTDALGVVGGGLEERMASDMAEAMLNAKAPSQRDIDRVRKGDPTVSQAVMLSVWPYLTPSERVAVGSR